jgi:hypothetical protein
VRARSGDYTQPLETPDGGARKWREILGAAWIGIELAWVLAGALDSRKLKQSYTGRAARTRVAGSLCARVGTNEQTSGDQRP